MRLPGISRLLLLALAASTAAGCTTTSPVYDSRPEVQLSPRIRTEAARGAVAIPNCKEESGCVRNAVAAIRRSELRKARALRDAVKAIDRVAVRGTKRKR